MKNQMTVKFQIQEEFLLFSANLLFMFGSENKFVKIIKNFIFKKQNNMLIYYKNIKMDQKR